MSLTPSETFKQLVLAFPMRRKSSNNLFRPFRGLGNLQATCFGLSEASETFKQLVSAFPSPRKPSSNLFWPFRGLGNLQTTCFGLSEPSKTFKQLVSDFRPLGASGTPAKFAGYARLMYPAILAGVPDTLENLQATCLSLPSPRKSSAACFEPSEASETFSGVF